MSTLHQRLGIGQAGSPFWARGRNAQLPKRAAHWAMPLLLSGCPKRFPSPLSPCNGARENTHGYKGTYSFNPRFSTKSRGGFFQGLLGPLSTIIVSLGLEIGGGGGRGGGDRERERERDCLIRVLSPSPLFWFLKNVRRAKKVVRRKEERVRRERWTLLLLLSESWEFAKVCTESLWKCTKFLLNVLSKVCGKWEKEIGGFSRRVPFLLPSPPLLLLLPKSRLSRKSWGEGGPALGGRRGDGKMSLAGGGKKWSGEFANFRSERTGKSFFPFPSFFSRGPSGKKILAEVLPLLRHDTSALFLPPRRGVFPAVLFLFRESFRAFFRRRRGLPGNARECMEKGFTVEGRGKSLFFTPYFLPLFSFTPIPPPT